MQNLQKIFLSVFLVVLIGCESLVATNPNFKPKLITYKDGLRYWIIQKDVVDNAIRYFCTKEVFSVVDGVVKINLSKSGDVNPMECLELIRKGVSFTPIEHQLLFDKWIEGTGKQYKVYGE